MLRSIFFNVLLTLLFFLYLIKIYIIISTSEKSYSLVTSSYIYKM